MCGIDLGNGFDGKFYKIVGKYNWVQSGCYINVKVFKEHLKTHFLEKQGGAVLAHDYQAGFQDNLFSRFIVVLKTFFKGDHK